MTCHLLPANTQNDVIIEYTNSRLNHFPCCFSGRRGSRRRSFNFQIEATYPRGALGSCHNWRYRTTLPSKIIIWREVEFNAFDPHSAFFNQPHSTATTNTAAHHDNDDTSSTPQLQRRHKIPFLRGRVYYFFPDSRHISHWIASWL